MFGILKRIIDRPSIAIDLGTANTRIFSSKLGQIRESPSLIRHRTGNKKKSVQDDYLSYLNSKIFFTPLRGGVVVDIDNAVNLLKPLLREAARCLGRHPVSLASAPTDSTEKERGLLTEAVLGAGASYVAIIPEVWAAAIGAGIDISLPRAQMLIDIGEGVTDMAVIRNGRLIHSAAVRTACSDLQKAVRSSITSKHKVYIPSEEAERLTHRISSLSMEQSSEPRWIEVTGNDIFKGHEATVSVNEHDIIHAMEPSICRILKMIVHNLKRLPEHVFNEIIDSGICITGGGACISGIDTLISIKSRLNVRIAPDPIHSVINGEIATLDYWRGHSDWWKNITWPKTLS
jgi:rod shape-determining protein MreB